MDWITIRETKKRLDNSIIPFDELAALVGGIGSYVQIKPDQKEFLEAAIGKLKRQRQSAMNIVVQGSMVNANIKDCILTKKEIDGISKAFSLHRMTVDNVEWGPRAVDITDHLAEMNKCFKEAVRALMDEEMKDPDEEIGDEPR
jgi:hypothetical protein